MSVPGCLTASFALSIWLGALAMGQRLDRTLVELDALALVTAERAAECARLQAEVDLGPALRAELEDQRATLARWLTILPRPELATRERLLELVVEGCEATQLQPAWGCGGWPRPLPKATGWLQEVDTTLGPFRGTEEQVVRFLGRLDHHGSFVRVNSFRLESRGPRRQWDGSTRDAVELFLNLSTFRVVEGPR